jgi:hypothetical protein
VDLLSCLIQDWTWRILCLFQLWDLIFSKLSKYFFLIEIFPSSLFVTISHFKFYWALQPLDLISNYSSLWLEEIHSSLGLVLFPINPRRSEAAWVEHFISCPSLVSASSMLCKSKFWGTVYTRKSSCPQEAYSVVATLIFIHIYVLSLCIVPGIVRFW